MGSEPNSETQQSPKLKPNSWISFTAQLLKQRLGGVGTFTFGVLQGVSVLIIYNLEGYHSFSLLKQALIWLPVVCFTMTISWLVQWAFDRTRNFKPKGE